MTMTPTEEFEDALCGEIATADAEGNLGLPVDLDQAEQWMAQLRRIRRLRAEYVAAHAAAVARLNARLTEVTAPLDGEDAMLSEALEMFHRTLIAVDANRKTVPLPSGTLKSRMGQPTVEVTDEDALLAWAVANRPDVVDFPPPPDPKVKKVDLKKVIKAEATVSDGVPLLGADREPIPGVVVTEAERKFDLAIED